MHSISFGAHTKWQVLDNVAISEGNSVGDHAYGKTLEECKELCDKNRNCKSLAFSPWGACHLKDKCIVPSEPQKNNGYKTHYKDCIGKH